MLRVLRTRRPQGCPTDAWTDTGGRPGVGSTDTGVSSEGHRPDDTEEAGLGIADLSSYPIRKAKRPSGQRILGVRTEAGPPPAWRKGAEGRQRRGLSVE